MKKKNKKERKNKIIFDILTIIIVAIVIIMLSIVFRSKRINYQALANINLEKKVTTIFCSGKNIALNDEVYNTIKEENIDVIIYNNKYIAKISNENLEKSLNLKVDINKNKNYVQGYNVKFSPQEISELQVSIGSKVPQKYVSQFTGDTLITNKAVITEEGYTEVELQEGKYEYLLAYIIPNEFNIEDITINKGASKDLKLDIDEKDYTYGSVVVTCSNQDAAEIEDFRITAKEIGEYKIYAKANNLVKEANLKIEQSAEKIELDSLTLELIKGDSKKVNANVVPEDAVNKELEWKSSNENIATVDNDGNIKAIKEGSCEIIVTTKEEPIVSSRIQLEVKAKINSITENYPPVGGQEKGITYINGIMLVNKTHPIPQSYAPNLQNVAYNAFLSLKRDAAAAGYDISLLSGYRSYETQRNLYNNYVATYGQAEADTFSAKPGTSEHQTGLAMDVGWIDDAYGNTPSGKWLAANCYKYGFIIRYPQNKEHITGYKYEPWHIRYLGKDIAKDVYESGLCLEEYLGAI